MNSPDPSADAVRQRSVLKREIMIAVAGLLVGLIVLPLMIYSAGQLTLGAYSASDGSSGLAAFLRNFYAGLGRGEGAPWLVVIGPYLLVSFFRSILHVSRRYLSAP